MSKTQFTAISDTERRLREAETRISALEGELATYKLWLEAFFEHMKNPPTFPKYSRATARTQNSITIAGEVHNSPISQGNK